MPLPIQKCVARHYLARVHWNMVRRCAEITHGATLTSAAPCETRTGTFCEPDAEESLKTLNDAERMAAHAVEQKIERAKSVHFLILYGLSLWHRMRGEKEEATRLASN